MSTVISLLVVDVIGLDLLLQIAEQLLDWVQPWRVLGIEQYVDFKVPGSLQNQAMLVDHSIVHQQDDVFPSSGAILA